MLKATGPDQIDALEVVAAHELARAMLSAFTARPIVELRQRDKFKIETTVAYGKFSPAHSTLAPSHCHL